MTSQVVWVGAVRGLKWFWSILTHGLSDGSWFGGSEAEDVLVEKKCLGIPYPKLSQNWAIHFQTPFRTRLLGQGHWIMPPVGQLLEPLQRHLRHLGMLVSSSYGTSTKHQQNGQFGRWIPNMNNLDLEHDIFGCELLPFSLIQDIQAACGVRKRPPCTTKICFSMTAKSGRSRKSCWNRS